MPDPTHSDPRDSEPPAGAPPTTDPPRGRGWLILKVLLVIGGVIALIPALFYAVLIAGFWMNPPIQRDEGEVAESAPVAVIHRHDVPGAWPLKADSATLLCFTGGSVVIEVDGEPRALNETARQSGYPPFQPPRGALVTPLIHRATKMCQGGAGQ
ncbi:MAG TPA: hypothetical protein VF665_10000 [Longimicrobium sp.]|jgi:hypothetical protein|uniref:hypothetical protein n=1 Tax=Longimicrobium sp. TaxID=2029185 RepID=UPI002ED87C10